jgi:hypothetical protein
MKFLGPDDHLALTMQAVDARSAVNGSGTETSEAVIAAGELAVAMNDALKRGRA